MESVEIYNVNGQLLLQQKLTATTESIDVSNLSTNIYFAKVSANNAIETFKIIKTQ